MERSNELAELKVIARNSGNKGIARLEKNDLIKTICIFTNCSRIH